jgi:hypothetical protein
MYARRKRFWAVSAFWCIGLAILLTYLFGGGNLQQSGNSDLTHARYGFFFMYCFAALIIQIKQLFATPLASLLPGYRIPHLVVALILAVPVLVVVPLLISLGLHLPIVPLLGLSVAYCALVAWWVYRNSAPLMVISLALWFAPSVPTVHAVLGHFLTDNTLATALGGMLLLSAGIVGLAFFVRRLLRLTEEMPEYARKSANTYWYSMQSLRSYRPAAPVNYQSRWGQFFSGPNEAQMARLTASPPIGFWKRVARWRIVQVNRRAMILSALIMAILTGFGLHGLGKGSLNSEWSMLLLVPTFGIFFRQITRRSMLGYESLRPVTRSAYLRENAAAIGLQVAEMWLLMAAMMVATIALMAPAILETPDPWLMLAGTALFQPLITALAFRLSPIILLISMSLAFFLIFPLGMILSNVALSFAFRWQALIIVATLLASALILLEAYRHWLRTDLA